MSKEIIVEKNENKEAYELAFHLVPSLGDDNVNKVFETITNLVEKNEGKVVSQSEPTLLDLEYQMEKTVDSVRSKYNTAYFAWIIFKGGDVQTLDEELIADENVLRHLLIKTKQEDSIKAAEVAAIMNSDGEEVKEEEKVKEVKEVKEAKPEVVEEVKEEVVEEKVEEVKEEKKEDTDSKVDEAIDELIKE